MTAEHWDDRYATVGAEQVSWFEGEPATSLDLIARAVGSEASAVDIGGGASLLVDRLLARGHRDVTVVDLSRQALAAARDRVGEAPVSWVVADIREWRPDRTYDVWHDRAAYHFLTDPDEQQRYWHLVHDSVTPGGHVVIATFADDGPEMCSGLPVTRYDEAGLAAAMGGRFTVLGSRREQHVTPAGGTQSFVWVLAQRD